MGAKEEKAQAQLELIHRYAGTDTEARARALCLAQCRAARCVDGGQCTNSWPGDGSGAWFWGFLQRAIAEQSPPPTT